MFSLRTWQSSRRSRSSFGLALLAAAGSAWGLLAASARADDGVLVGGGVTFVDPVVVGDPVASFEVTNVEYLGAYDTIMATSFDLGYSAAFCPAYAQPVFIQPAYCQPVTYYAPALVTYTYSVPSFYSYSYYSGYSSPFYAYSYTPYVVPSYASAYSYYTPSYAFCAPAYTYCPPVYACEPVYSGYSSYGYTSYGSYGSNFSFNFSFSSGGGWHDRWRDRDCGWEWSSRGRDRDRDCVQWVVGGEGRGRDRDWDRDRDRGHDRDARTSDGRRLRTYGRSQYGSITNDVTPAVEVGPSFSGREGRTNRNVRSEGGHWNQRESGATSGQAGYGPAAPGEARSPRGARASSESAMGPAAPEAINPRAEQSIAGGLGTVEGGRAALRRGPALTEVRPTPRGGRMVDLKGPAPTITQSGAPRDVLNRPQEQRYYSESGGVLPQQGIKPEEMKIGGVNPGLPAGPGSLGGVRPPAPSAGGGQPVIGPSGGGLYQPSPATTSSGGSAPRTIRPTPRQPLKIVSSNSTGSINGGRIETVGKPSPAAMEGTSSTGPRGRVDSGSPEPAIVRTPPSVTQPDVASAPGLAPVLGDATRNSRRPSSAGAGSSGIVRQGPQQGVIVDGRLNTPSPQVSVGESPAPASVAPPARPARNVPTPRAGRTSATALDNSGPMPGAGLGSPSPSRSIQVPQGSGRGMNGAAPSGMRGRSTNNGTPNGGYPGGQNSMGPTSSPGQGQGYGQPQYGQRQYNQPRYNQPQYNQPIPRSQPAPRSMNDGGGGRQMTPMTLGRGGSASPNRNVYPGGNAPRQSMQAPSQGANMGPSSGGSDSSRGARGNRPTPRSRRD